MAMVGTEQWSRDSEVLPDGTLHNKTVMTRRVSSALEKEVETLETFERPPRLDQDMEEIEEIMPDGTKVVRQVAMNRVIHSITTRHESFDESSKRVVENYEVEEVVPNTSSAFLAGVDSDYEDDIQEKRMSRMKVDENTEDVVDILQDGSKVTRTVALSRVVNCTNPGEGRASKGYPSQEVVPGTATAFIAGVDSDYEDNDDAQGKKMKKKSMSVDENLKEIVDVLPDGTKVKHMVASSRVVHTPIGQDSSADARMGHMKQGYPSQEVVPGTASAFIAGEDSVD